MDIPSYAQKMKEAPDTNTCSRITGEMMQESIYTSFGRDVVPISYLDTPEPDRYQVTMVLSDEEYRLLSELLEAKVKHHTQLIERCRNNPSEGVRSDETISRHKAAISNLKYVQGQLAENVW